MLDPQNGGDRVKRALGGVVVLCLLSVVCTQAEADGLGSVRTLPEDPGAHWVWIGDLVLHRSALMDGDSGEFLGMLSSGLGIVAPVYASNHREIYLAETHYARGTRGQRTDVVTVYDASSLRPLHEIEIPATRAEHISAVASNALSDDGRFLAVFNLTPAASLSIVDVKQRKFAGEIETPGCALVYAAGENRFAMLCGDGSMLLVTLNEDGLELEKERSDPFFDPEVDPVTEKAVRYGNEWLFVSFEGYVHPVDISGAVPHFAERWSLLTADDRSAGWRIGGTQHLAVHQGLGRLYSLVHQGGPDSHKQPGSEIWVYDLETRERIQRVEPRNGLGAFLRQSLQLQGDDLVSEFLDWLIQTLVPSPGVDRIIVTQDEEPVLFTSSTIPPSVAVHDARTGEFIRDLEEAGLGLALLVTP
jgi:methylamine dehydrogenase heavy chain